ncbi:MAG: hypothetical protein AMXMBFR56_79940 [Polyangiaceae bacterium]
MADTLTTLGGDQPTRARRGRYPWLVLLLEADRPLAGSRRFSLNAIDVVEIGRGDVPSASSFSRDGMQVLDLRTPDARASNSHARLVRVAGAWVLEDSGSKNGTFANGSLVTRAQLSPGDSFVIGHTHFCLAFEAEPTELPAPHPALETYSHELAARFAALAKAARAELPVVLGGPSGTGKELTARAIHELSGRRGRFVAVSCAALPPNLVESELFGYRKGAFSGATEDRTGLVRAADRGTLFLDEIGDLPSAAQGALLRVLQEQEVLAIGSTTPVPVELRVVCATHKDLSRLVASGAFRGDLLARLAGFELELPALRERRADLGLLVARILEKAGAPSNVRLDARVMPALLAYDWPFNVRELEQCLRAALALSEGGLLTLEAFPSRIRTPDPKPQVAAPPESLPGEESALRAALESALREHAGNISAVSRALGKDRTQIRRWLARFALDPEAFR